MEQKKSYLQEADAVYPIQVDVNKRTVCVGKYRIDCITQVRLMFNTERCYGLKFDVLKANQLEAEVEELRDIKKQIADIKTSYFVKDMSEEEDKANKITLVSLQKELDRKICDYLGPKFNKRFFMEVFNLWVKPHKETLFKTGALVFVKNNFSGDIGKKLFSSSVFVKNFWLQIENIQQAEKDNNEHLLPLIVFFNKSPCELKKLTGKALWKKICKNTRSRNILLMQSLFKMTALIVSNENKVLLLKHLIQISSTNLKHISLYHQYQASLKSSPIRDYFSQSLFYLGVMVYCEQNKPKNKTLSDHSLINIVQDTKKMADDLGGKFSLKWSLRRMNEMHEKYTQKANIKYFQTMLKKYEHSFDWLLNFKYIEDRINTDTIKGGLSIALIDTPEKLYTEAKVMKHCIISYCDYIASQKYIVFSIKSHCFRSTLGLYRDDTNQSWSLDQHYGKYNELITSKAALEVEKEIISLLN